VILQSVLKSPSDRDLDLNSYSFEGKVYEIIKTFQQKWPVYDLSVEQCDELPNVDGVPIVEHQPRDPYRTTVCEGDHDPSATALASPEAISVRYSRSKGLLRG